MKIFVSFLNFFFLEGRSYAYISFQCEQSPLRIIPQVVNVKQLRERVKSESKVLSLAGHNFDFFGNSLFEIPLFFETDN